jgi:hypothetical protein
MMGRTPIEAIVILITTHSDIYGGKLLASKNHSLPTKQVSHHHRGLPLSDNRIVHAAYSGPQAVAIRRQEALLGRVAICVWTCNNTHRPITDVQGGCLKVSFPCIACYHVLTMYVI